MSSITASRKGGKPRTFSCSFVSCTIEISDTRYAVDPIPCDASIGTKAFRLTKKAGDHATYDLVHTTYGIVECDCADYETRWKHTDGLCKHGRALVELGLMPEPKLIRPETPPPADLPWYERERLCDFCQIIGKNRGERADGKVICQHCSRKHDEEATLQAFYRAGRDEPCCSPAEEAPCVACVASPATIDVPASEPAESVPTPPEGVPTNGQAEPEPESEPEEWPDWTDNWKWQDGPEPSSVSDATVGRRYLERPELALAELVDHQVSFYRGWGTAAGEVLARAMEELALKVRMTDAATPAEYFERAESYDLEVRSQWEKIGFDKGKAAGIELGKAMGWDECRQEHDRQLAAEVSHRRGRPVAGDRGGVGGLSGLYA